MSAFTTSRPVDSAVSPQNSRDLMLRLFSGEVLRTFESQSVVAPLLASRTLIGGRSHQFPIIGRATTVRNANGVANSHNPGQLLNGQVISQTERRIELDKPLIADTFIGDIDQLMLHFDLRGPYAEELGGALSRQRERRAIVTIARAARCMWGVGNTAINAARGAAQYQTGVVKAPFDMVAAIANDAGGIAAAQLYKSLYSGVSGAVARIAPGANWMGMAATGNAHADDAFPQSDPARFRNAAMGTTAATLLAAIRDGAAAFDLKNVTGQRRITLVRPAQYYLLIESKDVINRDFNGGDNGSIAQGKIYSAWGTDILMTNQMPNTAITDEGVDVTEGNSYNLNMTTTVALMFTPQAAGTVTAMGVETETEKSVRAQGSLLLSKYAAGHNVLRPECAIELTSGAITPTANAYDFITP